MGLYNDRDDDEDLEIVGWVALIFLFVMLGIMIKLALNNQLFLIQ